MLLFSQVSDACYFHDHVWNWHSLTQQRASVGDVALNMEFQRIIVSFQHRITSFVNKEYKRNLFSWRTQVIGSKRPLQIYLHIPRYPWLMVYSNQHPDFTKQTYLSCVLRPTSVIFHQHLEWISESRYYPCSSIIKGVCIYFFFPA